MEIKITKTANINENGSLVVLAGKETAFDSSFLSDKELQYAKNKIGKGDTFIAINQFTRIVFIILIDEGLSKDQQLEEARKAGYKVQSSLNEQKYSELQAFHAANEAELLLALIEGIVLGAYRFTKYLKKTDDKKSHIREIKLICEPLQATRIDHLANIAMAIYKTRDLINEPVNALNAEQLADAISEMGKDAGFSVEVLNKSKIESLKMGGLLAVNKGSVDPPVFCILEWKPANAVNQQPYVLVGKGVVFDTGGLTLKPTPDSMDYMKCDMAGAATVAGVIQACAANHLPIYIVCLIPATDNRPSGNAYAPGDIITMMDGTNVEMMNADAEGRMILADAMHYAKRYNPKLVIDLATLTGSAANSIGPFGMVVMGNASAEVKQKLRNSSERVNERMVEFPLWDDYAELIKSDIADIKNVGGKEAGAIIGGKFLEHFVAYPWMHFDIAGTAYSKKNDNYRGKGGTAFGLRLLCDFLYNEAQGQ